MVDPKYTMRILRPTALRKLEARPRRINAVNVRPTTKEIVRAFKKARGYTTIVNQIPKSATIEGWDKGTQIAYFCICTKTGSARWLDLWDADHFDMFTDIPQESRDCLAWFSHRGFDTWGSGQSATGRVNCYFDAAVAGDYSCVVQLQSWSGPAQVECLIDNTSYGPLPFDGLILQPHFASLGSGGHHFRIRQMSGSFFFCSLTVYKF
jgi:hypothetical protein